MLYYNAFLFYHYLSNSVNGIIFVLGSCFLNNVFEKVMKEYDELLKQYRHQEALYKLSSYKHINNAKLLWRMAQVYCVCAKLEGEQGHQAKRKEMMDEGFHFAERALKLDEKSSECHSV